MKIPFKTLFNPQSKFQETTLLILGILSLLIGSFIGGFTKTSFDGVFDVHLNINTTFINSLLENSINVMSVFIVLFVFGKIINSKTRWIDVFNTSLLYRIPLFLTVLFVKFPVFAGIEKSIKENKGHYNSLDLTSIELIQISVASVFMLLLITHAIILLVNGFKTATNTKKWQHFVVFALLLIGAEILSKILISQI